MMILAMSLKINTSPKKIISWVAWSILAVLFAVYLIRVSTWENWYYNDKEGTERAITIDSIEEPQEELIEEQPTESEVKAYTVPADHPKYLTIAKLRINNARIISVGVNQKNQLGTPNNIFDVGWYDSSAKPGLPGTVLIDGHNGGPHVHGVFKDLPSLASGDVIKIERGDGLVFNYRVVENKSVLLSEADKYMATAMRSPEKGKQSLTLISCTGEWSQQQGTYLSRQFTRAVLVEE